MNEPDNNQTETNFVDPNTDDLDAFNDLFHGKAKVKTEEVEETAKEEEVTEKEVDTDLGEDETGDSDSNEEDLDEGEDSEEEEQKQPTDEKPAKKTNRFQERINELTAQKREAERREAEMLKRLEALESRQTTPEKAEAPAQQEKANDGPTPDDLNDDGSEKYPLGEFDPQYIRDLTRHTIQVEQAALNQKAEQERAQREEAQAREALQTEWVSKVTAVSEKHQDFVEKTMELESTFEGLDPGYSDYLVNTIKSLEHGPEVLYHFANNLEEAQRFVKLGPLAATLALGEINARYKSAEQAPPKPEPKVSKAPTPPPTVKGGKSSKSVTPDTDDLDEFAKLFYAPKRR